MKKLLIILLMLISSVVQATIYYVSNSGSDSANGTTTGTSWQTLAKINSTTFAAGDQILLKKGDTWNGNIILTESGTLANPIIIGAYGTGAKPVLNGLATISAWTDLGSNIWESTLAVSNQPTVEMVTVNGTNTAMGRYPNLLTRNQGFLTYQSHTGNTAITSSSLTGTPDWTGAEVVIKTNLWTITKKTITSQSTGTLNFSATSTTPTNGYGFFIQNDARTLDKQGEWYYNPTSKKLKMYSTTEPSGIKVCADDTLVLIAGNYVTVDGLNITGANTKGILVYKYNTTPHHITVQNCDISYSGSAAIYCRATLISIEGNTITTSNRCAIDADNCRISSIRNNTINDTYLFVTSTRKGTIMAQTSVRSTVIEYNRIINSGDNAINCMTDSLMLVKNNYIDNFNTLIADAGAVYLGGAGSYPMTITGNVILNGVGNCFGTTDTTKSGSRGLYLDDGCLNMEVSYNTIANIGAYGIMIHNSSSINTHHNTVYNSTGGQIFFSNNSSYAYMTGNTLQNNSFVSKTATQPTLYVSSQYSNVTTMGTFNNNYYARPIDDNLTIKTAPLFSATNRTLASWQTLSGQDANSSGSPKTITDINDITFVYNDTKEDSTITLTGYHIDLAGTLYTGDVVLSPFTSKLFILDRSPRYYISNTGSDAADGLTPETAWLTLAKVNAKSKTAGDQYLFKRGDSWTGTLTVGQSGSAGSPITYGAYGQGVNPIITGFTAITAWTNLGSNIWESTSAVSTLTRLNIVTIGGVNTPMGRTPDLGTYYTYQTFDVDASITSSGLTGTPDWTGAEVVIRKTPWLWQVGGVTSQSTGTVNYTLRNANIYAGQQRNDCGFFFQADTLCLTAQNEWYYNPTTKKLRIYSTSQPTNVKVPTIDALVSFYGKNYITFNGIHFEGANSDGVFTNTSDYTTVSNCSFSDMGSSALRTYNDDYSLFDNNTIDQCNHIPIYNAGATGTYPTFTNNTITNTGMIIGASEASGPTTAITLVGNNGLVQYNNIDYAGYHGILIQGQTQTVKNNYINHCLQIASDGGGIYTGGAKTNVLIEGNIILNSLGYWAGMPSSDWGLSEGIYLDSNSSNVTIKGNTVSGCERGIYLSSGTNNNTIRENTCYNNSEHQIRINNLFQGAGATHTNTVYKNKFIAKDATQYAIQMQSANADDMENFISAADSNVYARPIDDDSTFFYYQPSMEIAHDYQILANWKAWLGIDVNSTKSPKTVSSVDDIIFNYNETKIAKVITLGRPIMDMTGTVWNGTVTLQPYTSLLGVTFGYYPAMSNTGKPLIDDLGRPLFTQ